MRSLRGWILILVFFFPVKTWAQQGLATPPSCEDRLTVVEALSAHKEQLLTQAVNQIRALQKQLDERKEGDKK